MTVGPVPLGTFYMSCQAENYSLTYYPNTQDPQGAQSLELTTVNETISGVQFTLPAGGNIAGRVAIDDGSPAMFVTVEAYPVGASDPAGASFSSFDGGYQINGLPPGQYKVRAFPGFMYPDYAA